MGVQDLGDVRAPQGPCRGEGAENTGRGAGGHMKERGGWVGGWATLWTMARPWLLMPLCGEGGRKNSLGKLHPLPCLPTSASARAQLAAQHA